MKPCKTHWDMMRQSIQDRGMWQLVPTSGEEAAARMVEDLETEQSSKKNFDPLMSMYWHFMNEALRCGGLYLLSDCDNPDNDNHYCPVCEFEKHIPDWNSKQSIEQVADGMAEWCRAEKLILTN